VIVSKKVETAPANKGNADPQKNTVSQSQPKKEKEKKAANTNNRFDRFAVLADSD
jgi:hypothetical protein